LYAAQIRARILQNSDNTPKIYLIYCKNKTNSFFGCSFGKILILSQKKTSPEVAGSAHFVLHLAFEFCGTNACECPSASLFFGTAGSST